MSFEILLGISLAICLLGLLYRFSNWFSRSIDPTREEISLGKRISKAISGTISTIFSTKFLSVLQSVFADMLLQKRSFNKSKYRWIMHVFIFASFLALFFMHAIGSFTFGLFDSEYVPTLTPSLTLRNVFGLLALIGIAMAVYRRLKLRSQRLHTYASDWTALILIALIMVSGFMLEGTKISSYSVYQSMLEEWGDVDGEEAEALEAYWVAENGLHSPNFTKPIDPELLELGRETNEFSSCVECHASNKNAFVSFTTAKIMGPLAAGVGDGRMVSFLWFIHIASCLGFLAWLPFSKMFHIVSAPISLAINRVMGKESDDPVNALNRQLIGLSACTHCGACTVECSSQMYYESFQNEFILPSEKVQFLRKIAAGKEVDEKTLDRLQKGLYICTSCDRCTDICPSGINLRDLFINSRYYLLDQGKAETSLLSHFSFPLSLARKYVNKHAQALKGVQEVFRNTFSSLKALTGPVTLAKSKPLGNTSYNSCYSCQRCTNICPVVRNYDSPAEALDMMPHQIIYSLGIGNTDIAVGSQMIWSCSTCYLCQEHCPNGVELTDIFYRLKNMAINKIEAGDTK
jgi:heterodisulfide reductase subunit C/nitrate reductase gamma subunit